LRFITEPTNAAEIIGEIRQFLPNIKGVEVQRRASRNRCERDLQWSRCKAGMLLLQRQAGCRGGHDNINTATQNYLLGRAELDQTAIEIQELLFAQAEKLADENGWR
jgi:hypothetical protein